MKKKRRLHYLLALTTFISIASVSLLLLSVAGVDIRGFNKAIVDRDAYEEYKNFKELSKFRHLIDEKYYTDYDADSVEIGAIKGMFQALPDGYSRYYTKEELQEQRRSDKGESIGIGIRIKQNEDGQYVIVEVEEDRPAQKAGLLPGDILLAVNQVPFIEENFESILAQIKSNDKKYKFFGDYAALDIQVLRGEKTLNCTVQKDKTQVSSVKSELMGKIGYVKINSFIETTSHEFLEAIQNLNKQGMEALILDLRDNPGGLVDEAVKVSGAFVGKDIIYYTKSKHEEIQPHKSNQKKIVEQKVIVLVNGHTASASELLTAAVKAYNIGEVIGTKTFGKGIIQTTYSLPNGSGYKLTTKEYLTPKKEHIHKVGITPDRVVENEEEQLALAKEILINGRN